MRKEWLKKVVPEPILFKAWTVYTQYSLREAKEARAIFEKAGTTPEWLDLADLERMDAQYPPIASYGYDDASYVQRGKERAHELLHTGGNRLKKSVRTLELGCWDGMVSGFLQQQGMQTTAVDLRDEGWHPQAKAAGVNFQTMNAEALEFEDESFDLVFSYASFEHFHRADLVMKEAMRVLKKGGYFYLSFGPLYMAPTGLHAGLSVKVPYCQLLWKEETIHAYTDKHGLDKLDYAHVNGWTLQQYRDLWNSYSDQTNLIRYHEIPNLRHLYLINKYPACFRSKTDFFDNLITSSIIVLFQKK